MCGSYKSPAIKKELDEFVNVATSGEFYEIMSQHFLHSHNVAYSRDQVKKTMFSVLYCLPDENRESILFKKTLFDDLYPAVGAILDGWRSLSSNNLPRILMRLEAYIFLDCIMPKIAERMGEIPIFTLHDSVVTLEEFVDDVQQIMYEVMFELTGYNCNFKTDAWEPNKILSI